MAHTVHDPRSMIAAVAATKGTRAKLGVIFDAVHDQIVLSRDEMKARVHHTPELDENIAKYESEREVLLDAAVDAMNA